MESDDYVILRNSNWSSRNRHYRSSRDPRSLDDDDGTRSSAEYETGSKSVVDPDNFPVPSITVEKLSTNQAAEAQREPDVEGVALNMPTVLIRPFDLTAEQASSSVWGIEAVRATDSPWRGSGVRVAVLDTGIVDHQAFDKDKLVQHDFSGSGLADKKGHGTHCAGNIFGKDVDGVRIGIAPDIASAFIGKVLRDDGGGTSDMAFKGMRWAIDQGVDVISMSLGFDFPGSVKARVDKGWPADLATSKALVAYRANLRMFDAIMRMVKARQEFDEGAIVVAASGNESRADEKPDYRIAAALPSAAEDVISVGALKQDGTSLVVADFSNTFPTLSAPGYAIKSANYKGGLSDKSGTSMACPHVAGVAALWWQALREKNGGKTSARDVVARLIASARVNVFSATVNPADRGVGIVTAPLKDLG